MQVADNEEEHGQIEEDASNLYVRDPNLSDEARAVRLKEAVMNAGGPSRVAPKVGLHPNTLSRYFSGRDPQSATLVAIADACGVNVEWLASGRGEARSDWITASHPAMDIRIGSQADGTLVSVGPMMPMPQANQSVPAGYSAIPRYDISVSAGGGMLAGNYDQVVDYFAFRDEYLRNNLRRRADELALVEARGDSMEPTIRDGDILTVDIRPGHVLESGRLYVLRVEDMLLVKRLQVRLDGSLVVHSDNQRYGPETVPRLELDQLHILGQVILVSAPPR